MSPTSISASRWAPFGIYKELKFIDSYGIPNGEVWSIFKDSRHKHKNLQLRCAKGRQCPMVPVARKTTHTEPHNGILMSVRFIPTHCDSPNELQCSGAIQGEATDKHNVPTLGCHYISNEENIPSPLTGVWVSLEF